MYIKPTVFQTDDLTEGVYAASGSSGSSSNRATYSISEELVWGPSNGQINYSITIPTNYVGKSVVISFSFDKDITNLWGMDGGNGSCSGSTGTLSYPNRTLNSQSGTVSVQYASGKPTLKGVTISEA